MKFRSIRIDRKVKRFGRFMENSKLSQSYGIVIDYFAQNTAKLALAKH